MDETFATLVALLSDVILPNLKAVQRNQAEQIAANDGLAKAIVDLRAHLDTQFALLNAQLTACQMQLASAEAALEAAQAQAGLRSAGTKVMIH